MRKSLLKKFIFFTALFAPVLSLAQDAAPQITALRMATYAGTNQRFSERQLGGKRALIMFWASDCPPCLVEMRGFNAIKAAARMPIIIVTEDWGRREQTLLAPQKAAGAIIVQSQNSFSNLLEYFGDPENSIPYTIMINENGVACISHLGVLTAKSVRDMQRECG